MTLIPQDSRQFSVPEPDPSDYFEYGGTAAKCCCQVVELPEVSEESIDETMSTLVVPSFMTGRMWTAADYAPFVTGAGAEKLAASAVAPLVAYARGYGDLTPENRTETTIAYKFGLTGPRQPQRLRGLH
jgi:hypothetical protein